MQPSNNHPVTMLPSGDIRDKPRTRYFRVQTSKFWHCATGVGFPRILPLFLDEFTTLITNPLVVFFQKVTFSGET